MRQLIQGAENHFWPPADEQIEIRVHLGVSSQQKDRHPDMKAAIQNEVRAHRAIILMEDYLQMEEGVKQKRKTCARPDRLQASTWTRAVFATRTE